MCFLELFPLNKASYREKPYTNSEKKLQNLISNWNGNKAAALEFLYVNWIISEKEKKGKEKADCYSQSALAYALILK
jgi:hypothetical protein